MSKNVECVKVALRCRPVSEKERNEGNQCIVLVDEKRGEISVHNPKMDMREPPKLFTYDHAFGPDAMQETIYNTTAYPIVESVVEGYNGTIFAYGQTGTGKTHTMEGKVQDHVLRGIIPRSFEHIFYAVEQHGTAQFLIRVAFLEIYNEDVFDLLSRDTTKKYEVKENPDSGFYVKDLTLEPVSGIQEMHNLMVKGRENRHVGQTNMNRESSRSHSIFAITVERSETAADGVTHYRVGKLNLVDLAGSERQAKTGSTGERLKEATNINKSLLALGNVISSLVDGASSHIPYRDSKLTKLLSDSLGGNTKTVMFTNIGPADYNYDETISTLRYANRAKNIKNKPKINEDPKDALLREYQEEIARLRAALELQGGGYIGNEQLSRGAGRVMGMNRVVEVEKPVYVEDIEKIREMEDKLEREKVEIQEMAEAEIKKVEQQRELAEGEKSSLIKALKSQEQQQRKAKEKQQRLLQKLKNMEQKVVMGDQIMEQAVRQEQELIKAQQEMELQRQQELELERALRAKEDAGLLLEQKYDSLQEEIDGKNKKLKKLWSKYQAATSEVTDLQREFQREREDMLDTIRVLTQQLKLKSLMIEYFVPGEETKKVLDRARWDENEDDWILPVYKPPKAQNNASKRPSSAVGLKQPTSEYARIAKGLGDSNTRFRHENIINLDLDLPERTTEDYNGIISESVRNIISGIINDIEENSTFVPIESYPNTGGQRRPENSGSKRPSTAKRPGSARKKPIR